jgi:hypothetical protein
VARAPATPRSRASSRTWWARRSSAQRGRKRSRPCAGFFVSGA